MRAYARSRILFRRRIYTSKECHRLLGKKNQLQIIFIKKEKKGVYIHSIDDVNIYCISYLIYIDHHHNFSGQKTARAQAYM